MSEEEKKVGRHWSYSLTWFLLPIYFIAIEWLVGWHSILDAWHGLEPATLGWVVVALFLTYVVRAFRVFLHFVESYPMKFWPVLKISLQHNALNNLLPARAGEVSFPYLMKQRWSILMAESGSALLWFRLMDLQALLLLGVGLWAFLESSLWLAAVFISVLLAPLILKLIFDHLGQRFKSRVPKRMGKLYKLLVSGFPGSRRSMLYSVGLTWLNWGIKLMGLAVMVSLLADASLSSGLLGVLGGELTSVLPFHAPAGVGTYEAGVVAGLVNSKLTVAEMTAVAVQLHMLVLGASLVAGALATMVGRSKTQVADRASS